MSIYLDAYLTLEKVVQQLATESEEHFTNEAEQFRESMDVAYAKLTYDERKSLDERKTEAI